MSVHALGVTAAEAVYSSASFAALESVRAELDKWFGQQFDYLKQQNETVSEAVCEGAVSLCKLELGPIASAVNGLPEFNSAYEGVHGRVFDSLALGPAKAAFDTALLEWKGSQTQIIGQRLSLSEKEIGLQ